jgi:cytochrome d ubiquinol oxidase subunit I
VVQDYFQAIANPFMVNSFLHMFFATLETSLFVIGGISAWYVLNQRHAEFFSRSLKVVLAIAIAVAPLQIFVGHLSAEQVYHYQPAKLFARLEQYLYRLFDCRPLLWQSHHSQRSEPGIACSASD